MSAGQVPNCTVRKLFNQSFCQPVRHPTAQSQSQSTVSRSVNQSVNQLFNQLFCEPVRYPTPQSQSTVSQSVSQSVKYPTAKSVSQLFNRSFCQSVRHPTAQSVSQSVSQVSKFKFEFGSLMLPDVNFEAHCRNFRCTAGNFRSTAYNVGSIYFKRKSKKLNSATFICHLQFVTFTSVLWLIKHSRFAKQ